MKNQDTLEATEEYIQCVRANPEWVSYAGRMKSIDQLATS